MSNDRHFEIENEIITNLSPLIRKYGASRGVSQSNTYGIAQAYDELRLAIYHALERAYAAGLAKKETL